MAKRRKVPPAAWLILLILLLLPVYRLMDGGRGKEPDPQAAYYLFQVSCLQMETLAGRLAQGGEEKNLDSLKEAAYALQFTHDRLKRLYAGQNMVSLDSLPEMMAYFTGLELGEDKEAESARGVFPELGNRYAEMAEAYGKLLTTSGRVVSSGNEKVKELDRSLVDWLKTQEIQK